MPYIKPKDRDKLEEWLNDADTLGMLGCGIHDVGQLNFVLSSILRGYIAQHGKKYETLNGVVGVLDCAKMELYRRVVAPYEDQKIDENGDVY